ncbi:MAG: zinc-ribbon domain-containing protein [Candidatus Fimenecus sp.]
MDVVKCPHCGKELPGEAKFCPYCMQRLDEPVAVKLPHIKNKPNIKAIYISAAAVVAALSIVLSAVFYFRDKGRAYYPESNIADEASTSDVTHNDDTSLANGQNENTTSLPDNSGGSSLNGNTPVNTDSTVPTENNSREPDTAKTGSENNTAGTTAYNPCANGHTWVAITKTVHHDEVGHYEAVEHQRTVTKYRCPVCSKEFASLDLYYAHFDSVHTPSYDGDPIRAFRNQYEPVSDIETYTTNEWVVDTAAYDETVVTGYKCSVCGKTK